jgi:glycosyltransferase involved in cell wall biosynthesis
MLSVVVSVFEQRRFLPWVLTAIGRQSLAADWELLICDDGSSEDALSLVREYSKQLTGEVRYIWQTDRGFRLARSRNNAICCARGDVIVFLDGDVVPDVDLFEKHLQAHAVSPAIVFGSRKYVFLQSCPGLTLDSQLDEPIMAVLRSRSCLSTAPFQLSRCTGGIPWYAVCGCNFSVTRHAALHFDERFLGWGLEDCELALRLITRHGFRAECSPDIMVYHLEETAAASFHPCRPRSHADILGYMRNLLRLNAAFPEQDLRIVWKTAMGFEYDSETERWRVARPGKGFSTAEAAITGAKKWIEMVPELERTAR